MLTPSPFGRGLRKLRLKHHESQSGKAKNQQPSCVGCSGSGKMPLIVSLDPPQSTEIDCPLCQEIRSDQA